MRLAHGFGDDPPRHFLLVTRKKQGELRDALLDAGAKSP